MANKKTGYYYVNVAQVLGIGVGGYLLTRFLKLEEQKAGIQRRSLKEVLRDDVTRIRQRWEDFKYGVHRC